jgi:carboxypeptidase Q
MAYAPEIKKIPAAALSTFDAELLSKTLKTDPDLQVKLEMACEWQDSVYSFNLIADLVGSEKPDEIILVSGHFDSWELGTGAHDDGAGAMHALESIYLLKDLKFPIKRTLRLVWYMNEEFGLSGARVYAKAAKKETTKRHVIAMESDGGGFTPKGISIQASSDMVLRLKEYRSLFEPYGVYQFASGGSGADIGQLKSDDIVLIGLRPDNHRYFEVHHSALDNFAAVNAREFTMGSATLAALVWLMDQDDLCVDCAQ